MSAVYNFAYKKELSVFNSRQTVGFTHTHKLNQLDRNNERNFFPPLKLTRPLAVWQESKVSVTNFGFQPFQCVVSFRQERVVFF